MALFTQAMKKEKAPTVKSVLKKYGMKGSLAVDNHSAFVVNIKSGKIDFPEDHIQVNHFWIDEQYSGVQKDFLCELRDAMMDGNWDKSDSMSDYFDVGWYITINIGKWDKPYIQE